MIDDLQGCGMIAAVSVRPLYLICLQVFRVVLLRHETERGPLVDRLTWDHPSARCSRTPSGPRRASKPRLRRDAGGGLTLWRYAEGRWSHSDTAAAAGPGWLSRAACRCPLGGADPGLGAAFTRTHPKSMLKGNLRKPSTGCG